MALTDRPSHEPRFAFLLAGLLLTLLASPLIGEFSAPGPTLWAQVGFTITVVVSVFSFAESRKWFVVGIGLAIFSAVGTLWFAATGSEFAELLVVSTLLIFCVLALTFTLRVLLERGPISVNQIVGAISVYLLAGVAISLVNILVYRLVPGSFKGVDVSPGLADGSTFFYYSFVTMTTLGYGDITPIRPLAQALSYLTAIAGQFYIAILVAYLVGGFLGQDSANEEK